MKPIYEWFAIGDRIHYLEIAMIVLLAYACVEAFRLWGCDEDWREM